MKLGGFLREKIRWPIWPLLPLVAVGIVITPHSCVYWSGIAGVYASVGLLAVALRYWWAWIHGAPLIDWIILMALCVSMGALTNAFVGTVVRYAVK